MLLLLQGGDGDADGMEGLAGRLVNHYTVVSYDRRGLSRSPIDDRDVSPGLETHGDDARRLLESLTPEPVFVFGGSIGALIGLELAARASGRIRTLVAHEPPTTELLPDSERAEADQAREEVEEIYRCEGVAAALKKFLAISGVNLQDREPDLVLPPPNSQRASNLAFFLTHDALAALRYRADLAALQPVAARIVVSGGRGSRDYFPYRCARALASRLGTTFVEFPGGHSGYVLRPKEFAAKLDEILRLR